MQLDFHYYAAYCAAILSGYSHDESLSLAYASQFTDVCSAALLRKMKAPVSAATTQLQSELVNQRTDLVGLQEITRIWSSFHFLPRDLYAPHKVRSKMYRNKYRLICGPNGELVKKTVELAAGRGLPAAGLAMHVLADTWAHANFAGTPSFVINNTNSHFYEWKGEGEDPGKVQIRFNNNPGSADDPEQGRYTNSMYSTGENSIMNLGHGRAGHLPDYSYIRYEYLPAWGEYEVLVKDNPSDYYHAFGQMAAAMQYLRGAACIPGKTDHLTEKKGLPKQGPDPERAQSGLLKQGPDPERIRSDLPEMKPHAFETGRYAFDTIAPYEERIRRILTKRQTDSCADWKAFGEELSGCSIPDFDPQRYPEEYLQAAKENRDSTEAGQFILAALNQKSMVTGEIFRSGNLLAGFAVDFQKKGFRGIRDYRKLVPVWQEERR